MEALGAEFGPIVDFDASDEVAGVVASNVVRRVADGVGTEC